MMPHIYVRTYADGTVIIWNEARVGDIEVMCRGGSAKVKVQWVVQIWDVVQWDYTIAFLTCVTVGSEIATVTYTGVTHTGAIDTNRGTATQCLL